MLLIRKLYNLKNDLTIKDDVIQLTSYSRLSAIERASMSEENTDETPDLKHIVVTKKEFYTSKDNEVVRNILNQSIYNIMYNGQKVLNNFIGELTQRWAKATDRSIQELYMIDKIKNVIDKWCEDNTTPNMFLETSIAMQSFESIRRANCIYFLESFAKTMKRETKEELRNLKANNQENEEDKKKRIYYLKLRIKAFEKFIGNKASPSRNIQGNGFSDFCQGTPINYIRTKIRNDAPTYIYTETLGYSKKNLPPQLMTNQERRTYIQ